jgi:uncharacterized C2H2 Zn-finger protein
MSKRRIQEIQEQIRALQEELDQEYGKTLFRCNHCGKQTRISALTYIQTKWYEKPYGCMGGDSWHNGEARIHCPKCDQTNRLISSYSTLKSKYGYDEDVIQLLSDRRQYFQSIEVVYNR